MHERHDLQSDVSSAARDWVLRLASGEMDGAEMERFRGWVAQSEAHATAFEQRRQLWQQLGEHPGLFSKAAIPPARPHRRLWAAAGQRRRVAAAATAIAASLLAVLATPEALLRIEADHRTGAHVAEYRLPDGSMAWLDAGSAIRVDFGADERRIRLLRGNAFFTVRHGEARPFRVSSRRGLVEDIGTSFEVRRGDSRVAVAVADGVVRVQPDTTSARAVILREGQGVAFDDAGQLGPVSASAPAGIAAWRRAELMIDRKPLPDVIREVARYRDGPTWVWVDLAARGPVSGALRVADADTALRDLAAEQGLAVTWLPGGLAIIREGDPARR